MNLSKILFVFLMLGAKGAMASPARYYIVIQDVLGPDGTGRGDPTVDLARKVFAEELGKRPEVTMEGGLPAGGAELTEALKAHKLKGYQVTLRLLQIGRSLNPPPKGKQYRVLERSVKLSVIGTTLPGEQLALGGDGESTIQADVGARISDKQERDLLNDALHDAISQAVAQALRKLEKGGMVPPPEKRRHH